MENNIKNKNKNLQNAKRNKNDEFYTQYDDVFNELENYKEYLRNKPILCPCDHDYDLLTEDQKHQLHSNGLVDGINDGFAFSLYFRSKNFKDAKDEFSGYDFWNNTIYYSSYDANTKIGVKFEESIKEFANKHPDGIVVTNPPFSLFRDFINLLVKYNLKFIVIGDKNAITYKEVFKLIKENKIWLGYTTPQDFTQPHNDEKKSLNGKTKWFTNLPTKQRTQKLMLINEYKNNESFYPYYDNYNAINVNKTKEIPDDFDGYMGVPITFLEKYNPDQFEIVGMGQGDLYRELTQKGLSKKFVENYYNSKQTGKIKEDHPVLGYYDETNKPIIPYMRIIIKNKNPNKE